MAGCRQKGRTVSSDSTGTCRHPHPTTTRRPQTSSLPQQRPAGTGGCMPLPYAQRGMCLDVAQPTCMHAPAPSATEGVQQYNSPGSFCSYPATQGKPQRLSICLLDDGCGVHLCGSPDVLEVPNDHDILTTFPGWRHKHRQRRVQRWALPG
jgi:hypothetical protein